MSHSVLRLDKIVKSYGNIKAVRGVSLSIQSGTCFGLLGPNGAGKSTLIELIEQLTRPDSGKIYYKNKPLPQENFFEELGVQFQQTSLLPLLTVKETLSTFRDLYANPLPLEELIETCGLKNFLNQRHEKISGGQRQKLLLAVALCNDPQLLLLDEPTTGLDPQARRDLWTTIRRIKERGRTVLLTTHYMDEAQELCDEIAIIDQGKIIANGEPDTLLGTHCKTLVVSIPYQKEIESFLATQNSGHRVRHVSNKKAIDIHTENLNLLLGELGKSGLDLAKINIRQSNLEDLFMTLIKKNNDKSKVP